MRGEQNMPRPRKYDEEIAQIHARIPKSMYDRLWKLIKEEKGSPYGLLNKHITQALKEYLDRIETLKNTTSTP
jgi:hypothetical protein